VADRLSSFLGIFQRLSPGQRLAALTLCGATAVAIVLVAVWAASPEYSVLYAELDADEGGAILERLQSDQVDYRLKDGGNTILVPRDKVHEVRLRLAGQGLPRGGGAGYEILDQGKLGWTDFVQKFQYRRALEGEIARTIQTLEEVQQARVHLVIPEPSLFTEDQKPTTASLVVRLRPGARLRPGQVRGMVHLVASAVEGLDAENVAVLDTSGNLLSNGQGGDPLAATTDQMSLARNIEEHLSQKAQSMLEAVLGPRKAIVRISAELDWEKVESTIESFDGDNPVVRSEERSEETGTDGSRTENSITNFEIGRRVETVIGAAGTIRKLTGAVFVDGSYEETADGQKQHVPRTDEEMQTLAQLTRAAIGFDAERGDELRVENISFDTTSMDEERRQMEKSHRTQQIIDVGTKVGGVLVALLLLLIFRAFLRKTARSASAPIPLPEPMSARGAAAPVSGSQAEAEVLRLSHEQPENVARLLRTWIREG
jgi:flagellar M-ring protein FliF